MKKINKCDNFTNWKLVNNFLNSHNATHALFLDIETTGFSPKRASIYLIGAAYPENGSLVVEQFFADGVQEDAKSEEAMLLFELSRLLERFDTIVTFYGNRFDIPFLRQRMEALHMEDPDLVYNNKNYVDLYHIFSGYKHIFQLENCKQTTFEAFLGIHRADTYDGGECIKMYQQYQKHPDINTELLLLQHNYEDVYGMVQLVGLYAFERFFSGDFEISGYHISSYYKIDGTVGKELTVTCQLPIPLPVPVSCGDGCFYLHGKENCAWLRIPVYEGVLKYFYPDYKDYYYLPDEDMAIHKSVAAYVDKAHRKKADAATCYTKKEGMFLPQYETVVEPAFYEVYQGQIAYFEVTGQIGQEIPLKEYCIHILQWLK